MPFKEGSAPEEKKERFFTGTGKGRAEILDPDGKMAKDQEEAITREKEKRAKRLEIPEDVKKGSADMVGHSLRRTISINEEGIQRARAERKSDERLEATTSKLALQQTILERVYRESGKTDISAADMYDLVQELFIEKYLGELEDLESKEVVLNGETLPIKDARDLAEDLKAKLMDEANQEKKIT